MVALTERERDEVRGGCRMFWRGVYEMRGTNVAYAKSEVRSTNMRRAKYVRQVTSKRGRTDKSSGQLTEVMRREIMC